MIRELAARTYNQPVISLYLDLPPDRHVREPPEYLSVFSSLRHNVLAERREYIEGLPRQQRFQVHRDLDEVESRLHELDVHDARALVVLKSGDELDRVIRLTVGTDDALTIDPDPYLTPLEAVLEAQWPVLVVEVEKEEARFWRFQAGREQPLDRLRAFVPADTVDKGRPGKTQRHRLTHEQWHLRNTVRLATRLLTTDDYELLVLAGDAPVLAELERLLPGTVRERLAGKLHLDPEADRNEWRAAVAAILDEHRGRVEEDALARLGEYRGHGLLVAGLPDVLEALNLFQARRLFVSAGLSEPGYVCREHNYLSLEAGDCPFDGTELQPVENVAGEVVEFARLHGIELLVVQKRIDLLDAVGGVAAVTYGPAATPETRPAPPAG
jgi:hypothetical protein